VPGLRREELAALAHVSVDYVVRLEQGRAHRVSSQVLDSLAEALGMTADEREHLFRIADVAMPAGPRKLPAQVVPEQVEQLLAGLHELPALVLGRCLDVLAWNPLAAALLVDFDALPAERRNLALLTFLDPAYRALFGEQWEPMARECVEVLRMEAGHRPDDPDLARLVGELGVKDADFRTWWASHRVRGTRIRRKTYHHPLVGRLTLDAQQFAVDGRADQSLVTYTVPRGSESAEALRFLALWVASPADGSAAIRGEGSRRPLSDS
jgi:transcriptional regulator with XRE-family HTH domain